MKLLKIINYKFLHLKIGIDSVVMHHIIVSGIQGLSKTMIGESFADKH
jgi:hypothetical protein